MYIAYIDASGTKHLNDPEDFVLSSLIIHENEWQRIDNDVNGIKAKHILNLLAEEVEFHAKEMMNRENIFKDYKLPEIYAMFDDIFSLMESDIFNACIISTIINKRNLYPDKDAELWGYRLLIERINRFLIKENSNLISASLSPQYCIMIIDSDNKRVDQLIRNKINVMMRDGTYYSELEYLIEDPLFTDSKWRNLSQLVDCISYCVRRFHRQGNRPSYKTSKWNGYYEKIISKFDTCADGKIEGCGLKIWP